MLWVSKVKRAALMHVNNVNLGTIKPQFVILKSQEYRKPAEYQKSCIYYTSGRPLLLSIRPQFRSWIHLQTASTGLGPEMA